MAQIDVCLSLIRDIKTFTIMEKVFTVYVCQYELCNHALSIMRAINDLTECIEQQEGYIDEHDEHDEIFYQSSLKNRAFYVKELKRILEILKVEDPNDYNWLKEFDFNWKNVPQQTKIDFLAC
jgi:hypothetical protein